MSDLTHSIELLLHRLSIPGSYCTHCGFQIDEDIVCPGCGWVDPLTKSDTNIKLLAND